MHNIKNLPKALLLTTLIIVAVGFCFLSTKSNNRSGAYIKQVGFSNVGFTASPPDPFVVDCGNHFKANDYNYVINKYLKAKSGKIPDISSYSLDEVARLLGPCYEKTGHIRQSLPYYKRAFGKDFWMAPNSSICHYADLCLVTGDYQEAKSAYVAVIERGSDVQPPPWPDMKWFAILDDPVKNHSDALGKQMRWENTHPNPPTPLGTPKVSNPTFNQARAIAYYLVGQRATYTEGYPTDVAHLKVAAQLYPTSPEILWLYAETLHRTEQDKSAFIEYDLAEKAATGQVKEAFTNSAARIIWKFITSIGRTRAESIQINGCGKMLLPAHSRTSSWLLIT